MKIKINLLFLCFPIVLFGQNLPYFISDKHGYLPKEKFSLGVYTTQMNDTLDLLGFKDRSEYSNRANSTSIGDLSGYNAFARYNHQDKFLLNLKVEDTALNYGAGKLQNRYYELFVRTNVVSDSFALDFGYGQNGAKDLSRGDYNPSKNEIKNNITDEMIDTVAGEAQVEVIPNNATVDPFGDTQYTCGDGSMDYCIVWIDPNGDEVRQQTAYDSLSSVVESNVDEIVDIIYDREVTFFTNIKNMKDKSWFLRFVRSHINEIESLDLFLELRYTQIFSDLEIGARYQNSKKVLKTESLNRNETTLSLGVNYSAFVDRWKMDTGYRFDYVIRDKDLTNYPTNHTLYLDIGYELFDGISLFLGGKIMTNQFNTKIPYLYNEYTQSSFDNIYGTAKSGLMISF